MAFKPTLADLASIESRLEVARYAQTELNNVDLRKFGQNYTMFVEKPKYNSDYYIASNEVLKAIGTELNQYIHLLLHSAQHKATVRVQAIEAELKRALEAYNGG